LGKKKQGTGRGKTEKKNKIQYEREGFDTVKNRVRGSRQRASRKNRLLLIEAKKVTIEFRNRNGRHGGKKTGSVDFIRGLGDVPSRTPILVEGLARGIRNHNE